MAFTFTSYLQVEQKEEEGMFWETGSWFAMKVKNDEKIRKKLSNGEKKHMKLAHSKSN